MIRSKDLSTRVLHVIHGLTLGGAEVDLVRKVIVLSQRYGYDMTVCCLMRRGELAARVEAAGIPVIGPLMRHRYDVAAARPLRRVLRAVPWSLVHTHLFAANLVGGLVLRTLPPAHRPPLLAAEHALAGRWPRTVLCFYRWLQRRAERILVPTQAAANSYRAHGIAERWIQVLPNGLDVDRFLHVDRASVRASVRRSLSIDQDAVVVGTVARLERVKGLSLLVDAVADLPVTLVIAGDGPERAVLMQQVRTRRLEGRVHLLGARTDVGDLLAAFDLFVLPSYSESFGIAVAEALLMETPVIVTEVGGIPEVTGHGRYARLVPPGDFQALSEAIRWTLDHLEEARAQARAGHTFVARTYSLDAVVDQQHALYQRVLGRETSS